MLIDDDQMILNMFSQYFRNLNYDCECYSNPEEAVAAYKEGQFDVVLTDYQMPEMNGLEVLNDILSFDAGAQCILMSGFCEDFVIDYAKQRGAVHFFQKPLNLKAFGSAIADLTNMPVH